MVRRHVGLLALVIALLLPGLASAENACSNRGINSHLPSPAQLDDIKAAGFDWVRFDFNWHQMEPQKGQYQWGPWDSAVNHAHALGLNVFATLAYTPAWAAADPGCGNDCGPEPFANVSDWTSFVSASVNRYKGKVRHWGLWNEPNLDHFYVGTLDQYVYDILIPGADAVKAADPNGLVLGPELAGLTKSSAWNGSNGTCVFGGCILNGWEIDLAEVLDKGGDYIDIVTHHFYGDDDTETLAKVLDPEFQFGVKTHSSLVEVMQQSAPDKEVWLTEWGWNTTPYDGMTGKGETSEANQAAWAKGVWQAFDDGAWPQLTNLFYYDYHDGEFEGLLWAFGIRYASGGAKPAYDALSDYFGSHPLSCSDTVPDPDPDPDPDPIEPDPQPTPAYSAPYIAGATDGSVAEMGEAPSVGLIPIHDWASIAGAKPAGVTDLSAVLHLAWSDGVLRIAAVVLDDTHAPNTTPGQYWNGDNIQLAIDVDHDKTADGYDGDDWEIGVVLSGEATLSECYVTPTGGCGVDAVAKRSGQTTTYEIAVPMGAESGKVVGVNLIVNEDDGAGREGWIEWTPGIGFAKDPSSFANVTLVGQPPTDPGPDPDPDPDPGGDGGGTSDTGADPDPDPGAETGSTTDPGADTGGGDVEPDPQPGDPTGTGSDVVPVDSIGDDGDGPSGGEEVGASGCTAAPAGSPAALALLLFALLGLGIRGREVVDRPAHAHGPGVVRREAVDRVHPPA